MGSVPQLLYTKASLACMIEDMADRIFDGVSAEEKIAVVGVLEAAAPFTLDIVRRWDFRHRAKHLAHLSDKLVFSWFRTKSYAGVRQVENLTAADVSFLGDPVLLKGRTVFVVDTVLDSGATLLAIWDWLVLNGIREQKPKAVVLFCKSDVRQIPKGLDKLYSEMHVGDYVGSAQFLVGYGLDMNGAWRESPAVFEVH